jgi:hypothetical protein
MWGVRWGYECPRDAALGRGEASEENVKRIPVDALADSGPRLLEAHAGLDPAANPITRKVLEADEVTVAFGRQTMRMSPHRQKGSFDEGHVSRDSQQWVWFVDRHRAQRARHHPEAWQDRGGGNVGRGV